MTRMQLLRNGIVVLERDVVGAQLDTPQMRDAVANLLVADIDPLRYVADEMEVYGYTFSLLRRGEHYRAIEQPNQDQSERQIRARLKRKHAFKGVPK